MISLSEKILQIHYFGNKCLIKTDEGLISQNEYVSFIIKYLYKNPATIDSITHAFINQFDVDATFENVRSLIQNYICISKNSKKYFCEHANGEGIHSVCPAVSGTPSRYVPYLLNIELTNSCNLNCTHCYKEANCSKPSYIDLSELGRLLSFLNSKNLSITLTGGEPTIHKSFEDIVSLCIRYGNIDLVTNGLLLKNISSTTLKKINMIGISLYGTDNLSYEINTGIKNGFSKLTEVAEYLHSIGKDFILTIVLDREKIYNLEKYIEVAVKLGATNFQIGLPFRSGKLTNETNANESWMLSSEEKRIAYKKIRENKKINNKINILDWERDVYEKKYLSDDPNNPSNFYKTPCMKCGAGTTQWTVSEDFYFRPCNVLSCELVDKIDFEIFKEYVDGKHTIEWIKYMKKYKETYWARFGLQLSDCCKRLTDFFDDE